jgi:Fe-S-cluster formation regulator IscX/YfhJ
MKDGPQKPKVKFADKVKVRIIDSKEEYLEETKQNIPESSPDDKSETPEIPKKDDSILLEVLLSIFKKKEIAQALKDNPDLKPTRNDKGFGGLVSELTKYPFFLSIEKKFDDLRDIIGKSLAKLFPETTDEKYARRDIIGKSLAKLFPETTDEKYARSVKELEERELKLDPKVNIIKQLRDKNIDIESFEDAMRRESRKISGDTIIRVKFKDSSGQEKYAIISTDKFQKDKDTYTHGKDEMGNNTIPADVKKIAKNLTSQTSKSPQTPPPVKSILKKVGNPR